MLKVFDAVMRNPDQMRHVFVHNENEVLTSQKFVAAIKSRRPMDEVKRRVFDWFMEYIQMKGSQNIAPCIALCYHNYVQLKVQLHGKQKLRQRMCVGIYKLSRNVLYSSASSA